MSSRSKKARIPIENRGKIIVLHEMGMSYCKIAGRIDCSVGSVCEIVKKQQQTVTVVDRPITGRKRITTQRQDRIITRISLDDRRKMAPQIRADLEERYNTKVSVTTVQRRLLEVGLKAYRARKKPRLTHVHRQRRMEFARTYRHWTASDWSKAVFSDESRFLLFRNDGRPFVRRRPGEAYRNDCVQPTLRWYNGPE